MGGARVRCAQSRAGRVIRIPPRVANGRGRQGSLDDFPPRRGVAPQPADRRGPLQHRRRQRDVRLAQRTRGSHRGVAGAYDARTFAQQRRRAARGDPRDGTRFDSDRRVVPLQPALLRRAPLFAHQPHGSRESAARRWRLVGGRSAPAATPSVRRRSGSHARPSIPLERVLVFQTEYRGHVRLNWSYNPWRDEKSSREERSPFWIEGLDLVVFADAGQGWRVGKGPGHVPACRIPRFASWLVDAGLGADWSGFGIYVANAVTTGERLRFLFRLDHRFYSGASAPPPRHRPLAGS